MRKTQALVRIASALLAEPGSKRWGYDLMQESGVRSGALYPILRRLLDDGLLSDGWEDPTKISGRPPRRYYELTELGLRELGALLAEARHDARFRHVVTGWAR
jgi:PadR family transcriptional regulator PadR